MTRAEATMAYWRVGRKVGRTIYARSGHPYADTLIGVMDTPALAQAAVEAHNFILTASEGIASEEEAVAVEEAADRRLRSLRTTENEAVEALLAAVEFGGSDELRTAAARLRSLRTTERT